MVPQDTSLFNNTVWYNIAYGYRDGPEVAPADKVVRAAKVAKIHDVIEGLPDKYETMVGERGLMVSG